MMDKHKQYQEIEKKCTECGYLFKNGDLHIMSMLPGGVRVFRCGPCAEINTRTVGGKRAH